MGNYTILYSSKILGEAGKQEILQQMLRKFSISNRLPNRYFPKNCRWVPLWYPLEKTLSSGYVIEKATALSTGQTF